MTYFCPFCKTKMKHYPDNAKITTNDYLIVKVGDSFKCKCSIQLEDSDGKIWYLNSWRFDEDGWYHLGSTDGRIIVEKTSDRKRHDWTKEEEPSSSLKERVDFT